MGTTDLPTGPRPPRDEAVPETYALRVGEDLLHVWQYRPATLNGSGDWQHVEAFDLSDPPRLTMERTTPVPPDDGGCWFYCASYECTFGCDSVVEPDAID